MKITKNTQNEKFKTLSHCAKLFLASFWSSDEFDLDNSSSVDEEEEDDDDKDEVE